MIRLLSFSAFLMLTATVVRAQTPASSAKAKVALYAAVGPELTTYNVGVEAASLVKQASVTLPQNVQEAWPHPSRRYLYVTWSNNVGGTGGQHGVTAFRIDPASGALQPHGQPISVAARSVFMTVDIPGNHIVVAYNEPSGATVHRIADDGTLGAAMTQAADLDFGVYAHQVRVDPSNRMVIVITRGNGPTATKPEDPGALKVFGYKDGVLTNRASIAPAGGYNFQPRHLEFHPTRPFVFITLERQNKLQVYRKLNGPTLSPAPLFTKETLVDPSRLAGQATSTIHAHPNGRFLYVGNRGSRTIDFQGKRVLGGGENSIAVYSIHQETGEPTLIQNADTRGVHPRTFAIDPSGRILVVANMQQVLVRDEEEVRPLPATLSVFRIGSDGKLEFVKKYDQDTSGGRSLFWTGMVALP
ncbi:MAG: beta-propeller fold lactonase family protein [Bryobacteraceae bacterium]